MSVLAKLNCNKCDYSYLTTGVSGLGMEYSSYPYICNDCNIVTDVTVGVFGRAFNKEDFSKSRIHELPNFVIAEKEKSEAIILSTNRPKGILVKFAQLNSEASRDANILFNLENQYRLIMLQKAKNNKPWELITKPTLDLEPKYPNKSRNKTFGALLGLFFGLSYSLFKQNKKNLIFSNKEIKN